MTDLFEYETTLDKINRTKTVVLILLIAIIDFAIYHQTDSYYVGVVITIVLVSFIGFIYASQPSKIILTREEIILLCISKNISIPLSEIESVRWFTEEDRHGLIRTFGSGGLFGYFGIYSSVTVPKIQCFAKRDANWVLIESARGNYIITPDDESFVEQLKVMISKLRGR